MPRRQTYPLSSNTWLLRREQVELIEQLTDARPGASLSTVLRDIVDLGLPLYQQQQRLIGREPRAHARAESTLAPLGEAS